MRNFKKNIIKILIILLTLSTTYNFTACDKSSEIKKNNRNQNDKKQTGYEITWYANILQKKTSDEYEVTDKIICNNENCNVGISIVYTREDRENIEISMLCMLLIDGCPVEFSIDKGMKDNIQYVNIINGKEIIYYVNFDTIGDKLSEHDMVFLAIPYYENITDNISENTIMYCKKTLINEMDIPDKDMLKIDNEYKTAESTLEICGKELYEISEYNGSVKDFLLCENDNITYIGDYPDKNGKTYIFIDGKLYEENNNVYCLKWNNDNKRYVYKEYNISELSPGRHIAFAVTIMENEIVVARKSFNEEIIK